MIWFVCLDDNGGMMFGNRRQSKDRVLRERMLTCCKDTTLWMSPYSATQFETTDGICVDEGYAEAMPETDACFVEDGAFPKTLPSTLVIYRWNRRYPATRRFPFDPPEEGYRLVASAEFAGSSHDKITEDRYEKE